MNSEPKASSNGTIAPYDAPFKILSEKQLEWIQIKAKHKLLELREEEEWRKYCQEQNYFSGVEDYTTANENPLNFDDVTDKATEKTIKSVSNEQAVDHKKKTKATKKAVVNPNKSKGSWHESAPPLKVSHFQKTRIENPFNFPVSVKLNVLKVEKQGSEDRANSDSSDGEDKVNIPQYAVPVRRRALKAVDMPDVEYNMLSSDLSEVLPYSKVKKNTGFSLPYSLKQRHYLARKAYLTSLAKPDIYRKKIHLSSEQNIVEKVVSKKSPTGATASKKINSKFQNPSKTKNLKSQEKMNTEGEKENLKQKTRSVPARSKKLNKLQKDASKKVAEFILDEILDEVISKVEHEEEDKRKRFMFGQLNNILQKLNDIESEESAIQHKWETFVVGNPHREGVSVVFSPSKLPTDVPKSSSAAEEKLPQTTVDAIFGEAVKRSEVTTHSSNSEIATIKKIPCPQNSVVNKHLMEDVNAFHQHPAQHSLTATETDKQTTELSKAIDLLNFKSEREIGVTSESLRRIYNYRKCFIQYLKQSSQISRQHCDFWNVSAETADQILEECLQEVTEELCEIPSSLIVDLYNQEFEHSYVHS